MKKLFTLVAIALLGGAVSVNAQNKVWNFSDSQWTVQELTSNTTVDGLTISAESSHSVKIEECDDAITIDGANADYTCTKKLNFGGKSNSKYRNCSFQVDGPCTIRVAAQSNGSDDRTYNVSINEYTNAVAEGLTAKAKDTQAIEESYTYTGNEPTTVYVWGDASICLYYIEVTYSTGASITNITTEEQQTRTLQSTTLRASV